MPTALRLRPPGRYQHQDELERFVRFCQERGVRRYLEIGSRWGESFYAVMANLPVPSFGMSIDLPENEEKAQSLMGTAAELRGLGHDILTMLYDSRSKEAAAVAKLNGPYDLVFIDGDHTYAGVSADWTDYHWLAPIVALHDVSAPDTWMSDGKPNGVGRFWREIRERRGFREFFEFITPSDRPMGYGIVVR
jgi:hypothetical protein